MDIRFRNSVHIHKNNLTCKYCNRVFRRQGDLIKHVTMTHGIKLTSLRTPIAGTYSYHDPAENEDENDEYEMSENNAKHSRGGPTWSTNSALHRNPTRDLSDFEENSSLPRILSRKLKTATSQSARLSLLEQTKAVLPPCITVTAINGELERDDNPPAPSVLPRIVATEKDPLELDEYDYDYYEEEPIPDRIRFGASPEGHANDNEQEEIGTIQRVESVKYKDEGTNLTNPDFNETEHLDDIYNDMEFISEVDGMNDNTDPEDMEDFEMHPIRPKENHQVRDTDMSNIEDDSDLEIVWVWGDDEDDEDSSKLPQIKERDNQHSSIGVELDLLDESIEPNQVSPANSVSPDSSFISTAANSNFNRVNHQSLGSNERKQKFPHRKTTPDSLLFTNYSVDGPQVISVGVIGEMEEDEPDEHDYEDGSNSGVEHVEQIRFRRQPKSKCRICGYFILNKQMERHMMQHSLTPPSPKFKCSGCRLAFRDVRRLNVHVALVHRGKGTQRHQGPGLGHTCDLCHRHFNTITNLRVHYRSHTGEQPYSCRYCVSRFTQISSVNRHLKAQHPRMPQGSRGYIRDRLDRQNPRSTM